VSQTLNLANTVLTIKIFITFVSFVAKTDSHIFEKHDKYTSHRMNSKPHIEDIDDKVIDYII
jgi:hypothetical protein